MIKSGNSENGVRTVCCVCDSENGEQVWVCVCVKETEQ